MTSRGWPHGAGDLVVLKLTQKRWSVGMPGSAIVAEPMGWDARQRLTDSGVGSPRHPFVFTLELSFRLN